MTTASLDLALLSPAALARRPAAWWDGVLGVAVFGGPLPAAVPAAVPAVAVDAAPLDVGSDRAVLCEVWSSTAPLVTGRAGSIRFRRGRDLLFGCLELDDRGAGPLALQEASARAYRALFTLIDEAGYPFLWRVWNYLPGINEEAEGAERYWQFNAGRQDAFAACGRATDGAVPAACALGTVRGPAALYFAALREAPVAVENPRQLAAYHYPEQYGPRSPTFSRASLARPAGAPVLFVSGTASIVGHETLHLGDVAAQTGETLRNIEAVLAEAARLAPDCRLDPATLAYKVYVRHPGDYPVVRDILRHRLGGDAATVYLRADVCRRDLLVEIEVSGGHGLELER